MTNKRHLIFLVLLAICQVLSAQTPGTKKWEFSTGGMIYSSPAVGNDGTIYVGSADMKLYAVNPDGTKKWEFPTGGEVRSSPAIGIDGTIYVGSYDGKLYAINPTGTKKWEFLTGDMVQSSPSLNADGTIYVGSYDFKLYAVNPNGTKKWEFLTGNSIISSPAVGIDGTIFVGSSDKKLYAVNPDGTKKWEFLTGNMVSSSPAVGADGTVYAGSYDYKLYAISPEGTKKWEFVTSKNFFSSPAIGVDGTIYIGSFDNKFYAVNPNGTKKWEFITGNFNNSSPAIGLDGTVFMGSYDNKLYAISPGGTKKWEFLTGNTVYSSPAIDKNGIIYIGSYDRKLYAVYSDCNGLASSCWPKFKKNNSNTGNAEAFLFSGNPFFAFMTHSNTASFEITMNKSVNKEVTLTKTEFKNQDFNSALLLPYSVQAGKTSFLLPVSLSHANTGLIGSDFEITYIVNDQTSTLSGNVEVAMISDDHTELSCVGKRAIDAYYASLDSNQIAVDNNKGVIYHLLGDYEKAEVHFNTAVSQALKSFYGFAGIKMNQGVVESDQMNVTMAISNYAGVMIDLTTPDSSVIAPQVYYNLAWEYYRSKDYADAEGSALQTIFHPKTNSFLKAKAYVLLGVNDAALKDTIAAIGHLENAIEIDPASCIADIAREDILLLKAGSTGLEPLRANVFTIFPNPCDGDFELVLDNHHQGPVSLRIFNTSGILCFTGDYDGNRNRYTVHVRDIPGGIYFVTVTAGKLKAVKKLVVN